MRPWPQADVQIGNCCSPSCGGASCATSSATSNWPSCSGPRGGENCWCSVPLCRSYYGARRHRQQRGGRCGRRRRRWETRHGVAVACQGCWCGRHAARGPHWLRGIDGDGLHLLHMDHLRRGGGHGPLEPSSEQGLLLACADSGVLLLVHERPLCRQGYVIGALRSQRSLETVGHVRQRRDVPNLGRSTGKAAPELLYSAGISVGHLRPCCEHDGLHAVPIVRRVGGGHPRCARAATRVLH